MKLQHLSFRTQIFLASLLLVTIPTTLIGVITANKNASSIVSEYHASMETIIFQSNLTLDTLLIDATKIADLPLLNQDIKKAMVSNYGNDYLAYSKDSTKFKNQFNQTNRLNTNLISCIFINRYGYPFEYNITSVKSSQQIHDSIEKWSNTARISDNKTYFAPLKSSSTDSKKKVLPMIKILYDGYDFKELGICYTEINFQSVETIIDSARSLENTLFIYNADGQLTYSSDNQYLNQPEDYPELLDALSSFNDTIQNSADVITKTIKVGHTSYRVNGCYNKTTGWHLVQFSNNTLLQKIYRNNFFSYFGIFSLSLVLGLILAFILSGKLSHKIKKLCYEIDSCNPESHHIISVETCGSNQELCKLIESFNNLNQRLSDSLEQNYTIRFEEQQSKIQMLQFQINHHFLYNTLNVIRSLANINNISEIETISLCMSELIRYNLTKFPMALLKEEIAQINRYMTIQNIRFPEKFCFDCSIPDCFENLKIPTFILQPFVENCIEHGFEHKENNCCISISCFMDHSILHLLIADNGSGIEENLLSQIQSSLSGDYNKSRNGSIGIQNVHQRIQSHYGQNCGVSIESKHGDGTIIDIRILHLIQKS